MRNKKIYSIKFVINCQINGTACDVKIKIQSQLPISEETNSAKLKIKRKRGKITYRSGMSFRFPIILLEILDLIPQFLQIFYHNFSFLKKNSLSKLFLAGTWKSKQTRVVTLFIFDSQLWRGTTDWSCLSLGAAHARDMLIERYFLRHLSIYCMKNYRIFFLWKSST